MATNPLLQFEGPRRAYTTDEYTVTTSAVVLTGPGTSISSNLLLGEGIALETLPVSPGEGGATYTRLSISAAVTAQIANLEARVMALETIVTELNELVDKVVTETGDVFKLKNPQGQVVLVLGQGGTLAPALKMYVDSAPVERPSVSASSPTLADDLAAALQGTGILDLTA